MISICLVVTIRVCCEAFNDVQQFAGWAKRWLHCPCFISVQDHAWPRLAALTQWCVQGKTISAHPFQSGSVPSNNTLRPASIRQRQCTTERRVFPARARQEQLRAVKGAKKTHTRSTNPQLQHVFDQLLRSRRGSRWGVRGSPFLRQLVPGPRRVQGLSSGKPPVKNELHRVCVHVQPA